MPTQLIPGEDDQSAIMAIIGHVCIQWSLLEQQLIGILAACQSIPIDEAAILFGGLDMKPRLNMAINLAEHHKWPKPLTQRLRALRTRIDKEKLVDRRNLIVHGVHSESEIPQAFKLYTPRRKGTAQEEEWSILEAHQLGTAIHSAVVDSARIFDDYGRWKFPDHRHENGGSQFVATKVGRIARLKQHLRARLNYILR